MALRRGARKALEFLKGKKAGDIVTWVELLAATDWQESSLKTYLTKNKLAPFFHELSGQRLKILLDGGSVSEQYFSETFTQTAPRRLRLADGDQVHGEDRSYELVEPLGAGAIGHVWSAKPLSGTSAMVAVKVMLPREDLLRADQLPNVRERFRQEARNGKTLSAENIVSYLDHGQMEGNPFLVMELAQRSVADQLKQDGALPEEEVAEIVWYCAQGLKVLHDKNSVHRDVKPANLLEFDDTIKLGDLGIVRWSDFDPAFTHAGTLTVDSIQLGSWFYMAPEQQQDAHEAVPASDVYALGVTWIEMLCNKLPSPQAVGAGEYNLVDDLISEVEDLIRRMVSYRPEDRPDLDEIIGTLDERYGPG